MHRKEEQPTTPAESFKLPIEGKLAEDNPELGQEQNSSVAIADSQSVKGGGKKVKGSKRHIVLSFYLQISFYINIIIRFNINQFSINWFIQIKTSHSYQLLTVILT